MSITYKTANKKRQDIAHKRNFVAEDYLWVPHDHVINYNSVYHNVFFDLKKEKTQLFHRVYAHGEIQSSPSGEGFLAAHLYAELNQSCPFPWFIVNGNTDILAHLHFTWTDLKALNQHQQVAFFFYEPLFQVNKETRRWPAFYDQETSLVFPELIWIERFLDNHGAQFKPVVYVCDFNLSHYLKAKNMHPRLEVRTWDLFLYDAAHGFFWRDANLLSKNDIVFRFQSKISKKFMCPNFRYEGIREVVVSYLIARWGADQGYISFFYHSQMAELQDLLPYPAMSLSDWDVIQSGRKALHELVPLTLDTANSRACSAKDLLPDFDRTSNLKTDEDMEFFYLDSFLSIVTESRFGVLCGEVSEKVLRPMVFMRPFVIFGAPYLLKYLKSLGFRTFSDFWDESYDEIEDHKLRTEALFRVLDSVLNQDLHSMEKLLVQMKEILEHNRNLVLLHLRDKMLAELKESSGERS